MSLCYKIFAKKKKLFRHFFFKPQGGDVVCKLLSGLLLPNIIVALGMHIDA